MSWYNPSIAKARQEDTPRNPVILATCQVIDNKRGDRLDVGNDQSVRDQLGTCVQLGNPPQLIAINWSM